MDSATTRAVALANHRTSELRVNPVSRLLDRVVPLTFDPRVFSSAFLERRCPGITRGGKFDVRYEFLSHVGNGLYAVLNGIYRLLRLFSKLLLLAGAILVPIFLLARSRD